MQIPVGLTRAKWIPHSIEDQEAVRAAMEKVLLSTHFRNSKRYPGFLRYVVDQTLSGNTDELKERTIGIYVFGRAPDYDTNADTVVRYTAGEVRKRLALHFHDAPDAPIQIVLSARSYQPEFYRIVEDGAAQASFAESNHPAAAHRAHVAADDPPACIFWHMQRRIPVWFALLILGVSLSWVGRWALMRYLSEGTDRFWSSITHAKGPVLICPGGITLPPNSIIGTHTADISSEDPTLSFENSLAMGRIAVFLNSNDSDYRIQPPASLTLAQISESPVILIGAYDNLWARRLLLPFRFHFGQKPNEEIVDTWHPEKHWARDSSKPFSDTPDYGIVARFRNPSTDSMVVVVAGLQRYGTDAASQFAVSSYYLNLFNRQVGSDWANKNIEVVIRADVVNGRAGTPIIEETYVW